MPIELPRNEFDILKQDEEELVLYDKVVDKLYTYTHTEKKWHFPPGSRMDVINKILGAPLFGDEGE